MNKLIIDRISQSIEVKNRMLNDERLLSLIEEVATLIAESLKRGGKIIIGGNGGSESDSLHFAGEIIGRFQKERKPWPAIVLGSDPASLTAISNDYGYENAYARELLGYASNGDVFFGISTSGNSKNIINAVEAAKNINCTSVALLGGNGGKLSEIADYSIIIPENITSRVQECHILIIHIICELVELFMLEDCNE